MNKIIDIAPLIIFVALILVLLTFLSEKEDQLESVLIDSTFPEFSIASLKDPKRNLSKKDISELPALINVWATWCIACRIEHPFLMDLKKNSVLKIYGLNYKDEREKALDLLKGMEILMSFLSMILMEGLPLTSEYMELLRRSLLMKME